LTDEEKLVMLQILPDDEKAARELAEKAGISVADLTLLALRYCLRARGAAPFRELLAKGGIQPTSASSGNLLDVENALDKENPA
jgi:hypothetical protein